MEGRHKASGGNALRAAVLGSNDGLVSILSLVMGVAGANLNSHDVFIAGIAGLLAGAGSMALGEWLSVQSSRELYAHQIKIEKEELESNPSGRAGGIGPHLSSQRIARSPRPGTFCRHHDHRSRIPSWIPWHGKNSVLTLRNWVDRHTLPPYILFIILRGGPIPPAALCFFEWEYRHLYQHGCQRDRPFPGGCRDHPDDRAECFVFRYSPGHYWTGWLPSSLIGLVN